MSATWCYEWSSTTDEFYKDRHARNSSWPGELLSTQRPNTFAQTYLLDQTFPLQSRGGPYIRNSLKNPLANLRKLPLASVTATREILLCFVSRNGYNVHALHVDAKTVLGPWVHVASHDTVLRMMEYLGATKEQLATHCDHQRSWGQGSSHMRLLPNKRNLLKIDYRLL